MGTWCWQEGKYLLEPLLYCDLLAEEGRAEAVVAVLTGMRLLTVNSGSWRVQLNLPLRKLHTITHGADHVLILQLKPRRAAGGPQPSSAATSGEIRRMPCYNDEAAAIMHDHLVDALNSLRARRHIWHTSSSAERGERMAPALRNAAMGVSSEQMDRSLLSGERVS